ncbi:hypothetical protein [Undibacterium sp.]|uniref:hypothetical protein n=1 Tax=Undibacterium sp. TaxID=1914977 RepID=UPI00374D43E8
MKNIFICAFLSLVFQSALAGKPFPKDVRQFVSDAETCIHFSGEWDDNDKLRQKEITDAVNKFCRTAKKERAALKKKYKHRPDVQTELGKYADVDSVLGH